MQSHTKSESYKPCPACNKVHLLDDDQATCKGVTNDKVKELTAQIEALQWLVDNADVENPLGYTIQDRIKELEAERDRSYTYFRANARLPQAEN